MKGLIYFTDGLGQFPDKAPDYDTAFVFMDEGENDIPKVPPWAMRVLIDEEGINRFRSEL
jgi:predicted metal-dependent peptidase